MNGNRGTGRTHDMLKAADEKRKDGRPVLIVVHDDVMIRYCRMLCERHGFTFRSGEFTTPSHAVKRLRGLSSDRVFVDHAVWEIWSRDTSPLWRELELMRKMGR